MVKLNFGEQILNVLTAEIKKEQESRIVVEFITFLA